MTEVTLEMVCPFCGGDGTISGSGGRLCEYCSASGYLSLSARIDITEITDKVDEAINKTNDVSDKCDDIMSKCNDIFEKVDV